MTEVAQDNSGGDSVAPSEGGLSLDRPDSENVNNDNNANGGGVQGSTQSDFRIPDEYKDKSWVQKVNSYHDAFKQIDNLNSLVGKKNLYPGEDATEQEIIEYYSGLRPESAESYDLGEGKGAYDDEYRQLLYDSNISSHQAKGLIEGFNAMQDAKLKESTSPEGFTKIMVEKFGDEAKSRHEKVTNFLNKNLSDSSQEVLYSMSNDHLGAVYEVVNKILDSHGVKEGGGGLHGGNAGSVAPRDIKAEISAKRAEVRTEDSKPIPDYNRIQQLNNEIKNMYKYGLDNKLI